MKKKILIFQPKIQHYRLPLFDIINNKYDIKVLGVTKNGEAINGGFRDYFEHVKYFNLLGLHFWRKLILPIIRNRPEIVVITASPRNFSAWIIPIISKFLNFKLVGWSKINSDKSIENRIKKKLKSFFYSNFDHLILYGEKSKRELKNIGINNSKIFVAYNTIDTNFYKNNKIFVDQNCIISKKKYQLNNIKNKFLCLGRMINEKKQINIINAWKSSKLDKKQSRLIFVGTGPNFKKIKDLINQDESILLVGHVPWGFDYVWLSICEYTIFGGAIGLACQQAFLMKSLVIAPYENSSDSEFLINNVNCILYKKENFTELSEIFETVTNSEENNKKMVIKAFSYISQERTIENMAKKFIEAIEA